MSASSVPTKVSAYYHYLAPLQIKSLSTLVAFMVLDTMQLALAE